MAQPRRPMQLPHGSRTWHMRCSPFNHAGPAVERGAERLQVRQRGVEAVVAQYTTLRPRTRQDLSSAG